MPHISKKELEPYVREEIEAQLLRAFSNVQKKESQEVLEELLTETERLMIAKRLATIRMLQKDYSYYRIEQSLGISVSTSKRLHEQLLAGTFPTIEKQASRSREQAALLKTIETILRAGLPPRAYVYRKKKKNL
jgi:uncharacterized protein YerC